MRRTLKIIGLVALVAAVAGGLYYDRERRRVDVEISAFNEDAKIELAQYDSRLPEDAKWFPVETPTIRVTKGAYLFRLTESGSDKQKVGLIAINDTKAVILK